MQFTTAPKTVTATLAGTSDVSIVNTPDVHVPAGVAVTNAPNVGVPGGVAVTNTPDVHVPAGVAVTNTPDVGVPGGVAVTNTPNVGVPSAGTTLQPTGMPTFVGRNVNAQASASLTVSGTTGGTTLIAAPGVGKALELHALLVTVAATPSGSGAIITVSLERSDTGAVIWSAVFNPPSTAPSNWQVPSDFQGATLPLNVGLTLFVSAGSLSGDAVVANINYSVVQ